MKLLRFGLTCYVLSLTPACSFAANDAAVEAQEGDINHWIEYYKKQRDESNETVTTEPVAPGTEPSGAGDTGPGRLPEQAPASQPGDR
jgi:hypothetical protein